MVIRAGLKPRITALKGLCPYHLDERTRFTGSFLPALGIGCNKNIINVHTEECCKNDQIIDSRERSSTLSLVNRLRGMEPKDNLYVCYGKPSRLPQSYNIGTGQCQINGGNVHHLHLLFRMILTIGYEKPLASHSRQAAFYHSDRTMPR